MILLGWQDSLVYRLNALVWVLYAVVPSVTLMLVWLAAYGSQPDRAIGGFTLGEMMTYYWLITVLSVCITPNPEWDIASAIRDGKITPFIVKPIGYFGYRSAWESSYQVVKSAMAAPAFLLVGWVFRQYIQLPEITAGRLILFLCAVAGAYILLLQLKFLLGMSAFWIAEPHGLLEIWNVLSALFAGRLIPLNLLPVWAQLIGTWLPFAVAYAFPVSILQGRVDGAQLTAGFLTQWAWIGLLAVAVRYGWRRGLLAYEAYGG